MGQCLTKGDDKNGKKNLQLPEGTTLKILLVGDSTVGKTSIICRFADGMFNETQEQSIEVDFPSKLKEIDVDGSKLKLQIWDTAGQEKFRTITASYYRGAHGVIIVYDISNKESFKNAKHWVRDIELYASESVNRMVVGNKSDLAEKAVSTDEGKQFASDLNAPFLETSAKDGVNITQIFEKLSIQIRDRLLVTQQNTM